LFFGLLAGDHAGPAKPALRSFGMHSVFYIIGVVVVVLAILSLLGLA
jgi:hypothetical protein